VDLSQVAHQAILGLLEDLDHGVPGAHGQGLRELLEQIEIDFRDVVEILGRAQGQVDVGLEGFDARLLRALSATSRRNLCQPTQLPLPTALPPAPPQIAPAA
jgi:hypothetical protein